MALRRTALSCLGCNGCQQWLLRSFMASVVESRMGTQMYARPPQRRLISLYPRQMNEARERIQKGEEDILNESNQDSNEDALSVLDANPGAEPPAERESVPWYLQVHKPPKHQDNPLAARQRIPDIPSHPPEILEPLLNHLSIELGMDDLTLLDLRTLDPPPALGANLMMIVGTARSEKHLHISADRICRWLRTTYRLRPYADGLLGRNELKLQMRRKAKRSRLLSAVGAKATGETEIDDGIRTGWVCVNIGRVKGGELPEQVEKVQRAEGVVGFGARTEGCSVVVQMLTEEKREELDLEKLWSDILNRARREQEAGKQEEGAAVSQESGALADTNQTASDASTTSPIDQAIPRIAQQARAFDTTRPHDAQPAALPT